MTPYDVRLARVIAALFSTATLGKMRIIEADLFAVKLSGNVRQRKARCAMVLSRGTDEPTLARIEGGLGIDHLDGPPPQRYAPPITVETRVPWPDDRENKWRGQDGGIEE